jgi:hypothetical protein
LAEWKPMSTAFWLIDAGGVGYQLAVLFQGGRRIASASTRGAGAAGRARSSGVGECSERGGASASTGRRLATGHARDHLARIHRAMLPQNATGTTIHTNTFSGHIGSSR